MQSLNSLSMFCQYVIKKYGSPERVPEERMAEEFRRVYLKGLPLNLRAIRAVAASCGIKLNGLEKMPENLRGYHEVYGDNKNIYFKKGDTLSGIQNTILHEIREMMETLFAEVLEGYETLRTSARHIAANKFASAVLLPEEEFRGKVYETGLDVVALSRLYSKSCSQVLLRMGEVLQGRMFFYAALYEADSGNMTDCRVGYWTVSHNGDDPDADFRGFDGLFPRKGRIIEPGSLVDIAARKKKACLVRRITMFDDRMDEGLMAIARPLMATLSGAIKVALVVVLSHEGHLLKPQIERVKPVVVESFHRHL